MATCKTQWPVIPTATCKTQWPMIPTEAYDVGQLPPAQGSSSKEIVTLPGGSSSTGVLRLPLDIVQLTARGSGPVERAERLLGGASSTSALRVPSYQIVQMPESRRSESKEIERLPEDSSSSGIMRIPSVPKVSNEIDSEARNTKEYTSLADLVKNNRSDSLRSPRLPMKNPILEKACSAYLQLPVRNNRGFASHLWHLFLEVVGKILPFSCFTGSSDLDCDGLVDCHNLDSLDSCDGLLECPKLDN